MELNSDFLHKNIASIGKFNYAIYEDLLKLDFDNIENVFEAKTKNGLPTLYLENNKKKYLLHSKYDPIKEVEWINHNIDFDKDSIIVIFGIGLGYHLFEMKKKISKDTRVFIVEHNVNVLKYVLKNVDLTEIFDTPQFFLIFGEKETMSVQIITQVRANFYNMGLNVQYTLLPNYHVYGERNVLVMKQITERISNSIWIFGNSLQDMFNGFKHNYLNIDAIIKSNCLDEIKDKYKDKPAIIVASGPSLQKNIQHLKDANGKALIISCDASLNACEMYGVKPDAIASIERDEPTYDIFYKNREIDKDIVLLGPGLLWPKIFEEYKGKTLILSKMQDGPEGWWHKHFENIRFLNQGHSCATVAFAVAKEAGCNPIILVGQDLAYTEGKKHSDITHNLEYEGENDDREAEDGYEVYLEDYEGNLLKSHFAYKIFKTWFEYQIKFNPNIQVIDATEGGAYIKGTKVISLKEAINEYCDKPIGSKMVDYLSEVNVSYDDMISKYTVIIEDTLSEVKKLKSIKKQSLKHYNILKKIEKQYTIENCNKHELEKILIIMQSGDKVIQRILNSEDTIQTFYKQIITQTIIFVKQIGNKITSENVKRNYQLQLNLMYMITESTDYIINEYKKLIEFIEEKKMLKENIYED